MRIRLRVRPRRLKRWLEGRLDAAGLLGVHPEIRDELLWYAQRFLTDPQPEAAEAVYRLILQLWPGDPAATLGLGACRQLRGGLDEAIRLYDAVLAAEPENLFALANRAECRLRAGAAAAARADLEAAEALLGRQRAPDGLRACLERLRERAGGTAG